MRTASIVDNATNVEEEIKLQKDQERWIILKEKTRQAKK